MACIDPVTFFISLLACLNIYMRVLPGGDDSLQGVGDDLEEEEDLDDDDDVTHTCQFCGKYDPSFTDQELDMHYWQSCPMLMSCDECGQVRVLPGGKEGAGETGVNSGRNIYF